MGRSISDEAITLLTKGFVVLVSLGTFVNLWFAVRDGVTVVALASDLLFVYVALVLSVGVFTDRLFAPRVQFALFAGLTLFWVYDYLERDSTLSVLLVVFGLVILVQQGRRLYADRS